MYIQYMHLLHCTLCLVSVSSENFLEGSDTMSESQSVTNSLPREKDPRRNSNTKTGKLGVAFDPSSGPSEPEGAKVRCGRE